MKRRDCAALPFLFGIPTIQAVAPSVITEDKEEAFYVKTKRENGPFGRLLTRTWQIRYRKADDFRIIEENRLIQTMEQPPEGDQWTVRTSDADFKVVWTFPDSIFELPHGSTSRGIITRVDQFNKPLEGREVVEVSVEKYGEMSRYIYTIEYARSYEITSVVYLGASRLPYTIQQEAAIKGGDLIEEVLIYRVT